MKLTTQQGQFDLPQDFLLTMERINPMLSDEGDASVPATLPASSNNLAVLEHRERIDRAERYMNKVEALLEVGPIHKRGQLVIDTVNRGEGIDASFAIDNGDLYVQSKNKTLKEIFAGWKGGIGMSIPFSDIDSACQYMIQIYKGMMPNADFVVFPVAVASYEEGEGDNKHTVYQYNNEVGGQHGLVYEERFVREGDINMMVPRGYGIAPFLKLQRLLELLFQCLDYTVTFNCFIEAPFFSQIAIVHNCSDCLCNPTNTLYYKDLVPDCTLSEFLRWLLAKFHVQPVVNSDTKTVRIMKMDAILNMLTGSGGYDEDISGLLEGDWTVQLNPSKRIVLTPTIEIEGTEAAAETFDKLLEKYGGYVDINELQYQSLNGATPFMYEGLVKRKATGMFYYLSQDLMTGKLNVQQLGTNYFKYDRQNSEETEEFSQADVMPLMLCGPKFETAPYIGDRINRHTAYNGNAEDSNQKIIALQAHTLAGHFAYTTTGTTQMFIPYTDGQNYYNFWFGMDNYTLYRDFWQNYNRLLLNNPVHLTGRLKYDIAQFLNMDMCQLKLCNGQRLLPQKASVTIAEKTGLTEVEFIRAELFMDGISDTEIKPVSANLLKWQISDNHEELGLQLFNLHKAQIEYEESFNAIVATIFYTGCSISLDTPVSTEPPSELGETRIINALATLTINFDIEYEDTQYDSPVPSSSGSRSYPNTLVTFTLVAVPA